MAEKRPYYAATGRSDLLQCSKNLEKRRVKKGDGWYINVMGRAGWRGRFPGGGYNCIQMTLGSPVSCGCARSLHCTRDHPGAGLFCVRSVSSGKPSRRRERGVFEI